MRSMRLPAALILCAATAFAQEPAPKGPPVPVFSESVEVRVLDLDVDVTDSKGQPVTDLKREDFTVKIAGKPVPIDYFTRVDGGTIHAPDLSTASPDQVLAAYKRGNEAFVPRNFLIYIDLGFISPGVRNRSLNALSDFVTKLGPDDAARIVAFDQSPRVLADWTTSKEALMSALSSVEKGRVGMSRLQTQRQTVAMIDSTRPRSRGTLVRQYAEEVGQEIQTLLQSMRQEIVTLTPLSGKKSFMFVSGGFEYQPGFVMSQYASGTFGAPSLLFTNIRDVSGLVNANVQRANSNEITFYTIDANGLSAEGQTASSDDPLESRSRVSFQARQDRQNGLQELAVETGGIALLNTNDFQRGLSRVYEAVSTYYSVGVNLSQVPTGKYEKVSVEVARPGVTVRARKGFQALPEAELVRERARATMDTDLAYNGIPATIRTAPATAGDKKLFTVPITVSFPASAVTFVPEGDKAVARTQFFIGAVDDKGGKSEITVQDSVFTLPADKAQGDTPLAYSAAVQTKKGNYRIVVNVRDAATGRMGTAKAAVRVE
ncbi:MAG: VWA domain-containing protein [Thermoanaerobaculia bacterium]